MLFNVLCVIMCCLQSTLSSAPSERKESILLPPILRLRQIQPVINHQLPPEANEINTFQLPGASSHTHEQVTNFLRRSLSTSPTSTLHSNYVLIQTGLCSSVRNCENILTAEGCRTYVQSQGGTVLFEDVTSSHPSGCFTFSATDDNEWYFNQAKLSTNIARQEDETRYRFVCDCRQQSPLLAIATSTSSSTQDNLEMNSRGLTEMRMVTNRRRLAACLSISTSGWNEWSASCSMSTMYTVAEGNTVKIKKSASMSGELIIDRGMAVYEDGDNRHFWVAGTLEMKDVTLTGGYTVSSFCSLHSL